MTTTRSLETIRQEYDRGEIAIYGLFTPRSRDPVFKPRLRSNKRDEHYQDPMTEDQLVWDLDLDTRVWVEVGSDRRGMYVSNILCEFDEIDEPKSSSETTETVDQARQPEAETHVLKRTISEKREYRVRPDGLAGFDLVHESAKVVDHHESPISCTCGEDFEDTEAAYEHLNEINDDPIDDILI